MLIDAFLYAGESDMLLFRLKMLSPLVDKFIIVESDHTFSGKPKPYNVSDDIYDDGSRRFFPFLEKIIIREHRANLDGLDFSKAPDTFDQGAACWQIEKQQRNAIVDAISKLPSDAKVLMGDVDEIPSPEALKFALENNLGKDAPIPFGLYSFYYNLKFLRNARQSTDGNSVDMVVLGGAVLTTVKTLIETGAENMRRQRKLMPNVINHAGWHLSYFTDHQGIKGKIESFSHQEYNKDEIKNDSHIRHCIETGEYLFGKDLFDGYGIVRVGKEFFPPVFVENAPEQWWG